MYTIEDIAKEIDGKVLGKSAQKVFSISSLDDIRSNSIVFIKNRKNFETMKKGIKPLCLVVDFDPDTSTDFDYIVIDSEKKDEAFIKLLSLFKKEDAISQRISEKASVSLDAVIGNRVTIGDFTSVGECSKIDDGTCIMAHTFIGSRCSIGKGCIIYPNVTIYSDSIIDDNVIIHSGVVIGSDGFSYLNIDGGNRKIPQIGGVHIKKNVEIGANTTIDRATLGYTEIGENTKIDNLVQIAHNVVIGKNTIICGLCGISGSVKIGNNVVIAGAVGLMDHIVIEDDVFIGGKSGVTEKCVKKGSRMLGYPATDLKTQMEFWVVQPKVRKMYFDIKKIKKKLQIE